MGQVANEDRCGAMHGVSRCLRAYGHPGQHKWRDEEPDGDDDVGCTVIHLYGTRTVRVYSVADFELRSIRYTAQAENGAWFLFGLLAALVLTGIVLSGVTGEETYALVSVVACALLLVLVAVNRWSSVAKEVKRIEESAKFEEQE